MIVSLRISKYSRRREELIIAEESVDGRKYIHTLLFFSSVECIECSTTNNCDRERNAREVLNVVAGVAGG